MVPDFIKDLPPSHSVAVSRKENGNYVMTLIDGISGKYKQVEISHMEVVRGYADLFSHAMLQLVEELRREKEKVLLPFDAFVKNEGGG